MEVTRIVLDLETLAHCFTKDVEGEGRKKVGRKVKSGARRGDEGSGEEKGRERRSEMNKCTKDYAALVKEK